MSVPQPSPFVVFGQFDSNAFRDKNETPRSQCNVPPVDGWMDGMALDIVIHSTQSIHCSPPHAIFGINAGQNAARTPITARHRLIVDYLEIGELMTKHSGANKFAVCRRARALAFATLFFFRFCHFLSALVALFSREISI